MALSQAASKLLKWLQMYKINATQLDDRLAHEDMYAKSWIDGGIYARPRQSYAAKGSLFAGAMTELKAAGY